MLGIINLISMRVLSCSWQYLAVYIFSFVNLRLVSLLARVHIDMRFPALVFVFGNLLFGHIHVENCQSIPLPESCFSITTSNTQKGVITGRKIYSNSVMQSRSTLDNTLYRRNIVFLHIATMKMRKNDPSRSVQPAYRNDKHHPAV